MNTTYTLPSANWVVILADIAHRAADGSKVYVNTYAQKEMLQRALVRMGRSMDALDIHVKEAKR